jgi:L-Lysine epsilon oxidase N-terminal
VYDIDAAGAIVRELTGAGPAVEITWRVELANTKAAWYGFQLALDIPEAVSAQADDLATPRSPTGRSSRFGPGRDR